MADYVNNKLNIVRVGDPIGYITNKVLTSDGFSFRATNETGTGLDTINKTYRDLCGTTPYDINSYYPGYSFGDDLLRRPIPKYPFTKKYVPVPNIYDVKVYNEKVVKVFFTDGTTETAVCQEGDKFDLDMGITVCVMKKMLGRNEYFRMLKKAKKNAAAHRELEKKSAEAVEIRKRQRAKEEARKKARRERKNKELATAIAEAMTAKKKK